MQPVPLTGVPVFSSKNACRGAKRPRSRAHLHLGRFRIARAASDDLEIVAVAEHVLCRTPHWVRGLKYSMSRRACGSPESHPARGAWIEMSTRCRPSLRRAPSHPARGAWIEIGLPQTQKTTLVHRTPHGVRGLKLCHEAHEGCDSRRAPHGARGLKLHVVHVLHHAAEVAPRTGRVD